MSPVTERSRSIAALSARWSWQLGEAHSTLRASSQRSGSAVVVCVGGEVDASNEGAFEHLLSEMS
jgi:hypothetical protein